MFIFYFYFLEELSLEDVNIILNPMEIRTFLVTVE